MMREITAMKYLECSALTEEGAKDIFHEVASLALLKPKTSIVSINKLFTVHFQVLATLLEEKLSWVFIISSDW